MTTMMMTMMKIELLTLNNSKHHIFLRINLKVE